VDGRPLEGEFFTLGHIVNTMIQQLGVFTEEVTRVAREVGRMASWAAKAGSRFAGTGRTSPIQ